MGFHPFSWTICRDDNSRKLCVPFLRDNPETDPGGESGGRRGRLLIMQGALPCGTIDTCSLHLSRACR